jgi:hypothetical protein
VLDTPVDHSIKDESIINADKGTLSIKAGASGGTLASSRNIEEAIIANKDSL